MLDSMRGVFRPDVLDLCFAYVRRPAIAQSKQPISVQKSVLRDVISMAAVESCNIGPGYGKNPSQGQYK